VWVTTFAVGALSAAPFLDLDLAAARLEREGKPAPATVAADRFGPGRGSVDLVGAAGAPTQIQFDCTSVPAGEYAIGLPVLGQGYLSFGEFYAQWLHLYVNDVRLAWTSHTEPLRPEDAAEKGLYQAELRLDRLVRLGPGDILRVVYAVPHGHLTIGAPRLYSQLPEPGLVRFEALWWQQPDSVWLSGQWGETRREASAVSQSVVLRNPGSRPRQFVLEAVAKDYCQEVLLAHREDIALAPGEGLTRELRFATRDSGWTRLAVTASAEGVTPPVRLSKFFIGDRLDPARPAACLNGEWETCQVKGAEPGTVPPADAVWKRVTVPSMHAVEQTHCAWYRRTFEPPAHLQGERFVLKFGLALSEAWGYLNGQPMGHEAHGSQPFELDVTAGLRPGQPNELLVAVRDWLAYSPRNRERVQRGEAPIFKDSMVDVAGYPSVTHVGLGGPVWLEARPAVSVDDVFIVTSVRERRLSLRYRLRNTGPTDQVVCLRPRVLDAGTPVLQFAEETVTLRAGQTETLSIERHWAKPVLWSPEDPHLYVLETALQPTRGTPDRHRLRFGFRELWIDGTDFVLNGVPIKVRSAWASGASGMYQASQFWEPDRRLSAIWDWQTRCARDLSHQLTRTHNQAGVGEVCEIADEVGLMLKIEDADMAQVLFTFDQGYWNAALAHEVRVVETFKNHASVVMWSAGNENMWGWIYQGEAAKTLGNRWQIKIAKAIREADLMRRPVEWEADGDLMGGWEHHALHYPRELSSAPDLPNGAWWGPLDGKTVVPYSMGPITLGQKPLTVGEAFWPANLAHPYGEAILLGDDAYLGGNYWSLGWNLASEFFINGFRDAEFALIDTYNPLTIQKPQILVLKQEVSAWTGGQTARLEVNVHNDVQRRAKLVLRWTLRRGAETLAEDRERLRLEAAGLARVALRIPLPPVTCPTPAVLHLSLEENGTAVHELSRAWTLHPPVTIRAPAGFVPALYDPLGKTAAMLRGLRVPFVAQDRPAPPEGKALIIGQDALKQPVEGPWREELSAFVRQGGRVLILEQSEAPDFLPVPLVMAAGRRSTFAFGRALDHPLLEGLADTDLRWWAGDHVVSVGNYRKPLRGNFLPLIDAGSMDGMVEMPLVEEFDGNGSFLLCQMQLTGKAATAPAAGRLLQNLLGYLAAPPARSPARTALATGADTPLRRALNESQLVAEDLPEPPALTLDRYQVAIVDAPLLADGPLAAGLKAFATAGGRVLVHRPTPDQQARLEALLGVRLRFFPVRNEPTDIRYHVLRRTGEGLLAGVSNHELFWASAACLAEIRHEGCWWSYYDCPPAEQIADWFLEPADADRERVRRLTRPGTLLEVPLGKGSVVLSQLRWDEPVADVAPTAARLRSLLLTNLGCELRSEGGAALARQQRLQSYDFAPVDLGPYANRGLTSDGAPGLIGWTNQGENDLRALPTGRQTFAGIPFHIASPRAAVVLYSTNANNLDLPKEVKGIRIGQRADVLFFLHTAAWSNGTVFSYRVHYEDSTSVELPIVSGQQTIDWWADPARFPEAMSKHGLFIAWKGDNPMRKGVVLPGFEWVNPHPEKPIRDLDFVANPENPGAVPALVAITAAVNRCLEGVVTEVVGADGVMVRFASQEQEVRYIGVAGPAKDHPFYEQAVAAHRALAVGQKVTLRQDVVTRDSEGRLLAYVFLGKDTYDIRNLLNAKLIGDGLGKPGNFAGNAQHRMYLENLGFIAKQRLAGVWAEGAAKP
jgi:endonuclease YncB( thermonuclease family)